MNAGDGGARQEKQLRQPHWASLMSVKVNFVVSGKDSKDFDRGGRNMCPCVLDR